MIKEAGSGAREDQNTPPNQGFDMGQVALHASLDPWPSFRWHPKAEGFSLILGALFQGKSMYLLIPSNVSGNLCGWLQCMCAAEFDQLTLCSRRRRQSQCLLQHVGDCPPIRRLS